MHPRNPYQNPPDFQQLADAYPPLKPYLVYSYHGVTIDFMDESAQRSDSSQMGCRVLIYPPYSIIETQNRRLTEALLYRDFQVTINIPEDRICPPVPNRLNYILWLQDVVDATAIAEPTDSERKISGIDMSFYNLSSSGLPFSPSLDFCCNWSVVTHRGLASLSFTSSLLSGNRLFNPDVDEKSLESARFNVRRNNLDDRITVVKSKPSGSMLLHLFESNSDGASTSNGVHFDFTMCNPPFYRNREEILRSAEAKEFGPAAVCTGADVEMIAPGGEVSFVGRMVQESVEIRTKCRWYTSMLGKLSSLTEIVTLLRVHHVDNYACTEFVQGRTRRWAIAWSFGDVRLPDCLARISSTEAQNLMPARNTLRQSYPQAKSLVHLASVVTAICALLHDISVRSPLPGEQCAGAGLEIIIAAPRDTWSRAARRKKAHGITMQTEPDSSAEPILVCRIVCVEEGDNRMREESASGSIKLRFDWMKGRDRSLYESFTSHVGRKVAAALGAC
ncbi:uncharacterized protein FIBRA_02535 [Fibroporia radiculosa]|uniref:U6 small nuclear RNA (adenine-(43)-N(6))-methyltransferase n=1 Tax=Fibroporia radiculosa TaxID=599839 RepID=J4I941_9APHY|nr:uncharacterized protein FIBRA_02535 [Fibroporia radiculosa]CCM00501.1 predicted protein [Fibroporia radiculosa]